MHSSHWKDKRKKPNLIKDGFRVLILKLHPFSMKRLNADTKVHLAHVQAKLESVAREKIFFLYLFDKKIIVITKITTRCVSNFKGPRVSYLSAALSCEQRPFFLVTLLF